MVPDQPAIRIRNPFPAFGQVLTRSYARASAKNPNHHLWNNNGTWYLHYTWYPTPLTKNRVRVSLGTKDAGEARRLRDALLSDGRRPAAFASE